LHRDDLCRKREKDRMVVGEETVERIKTKGRCQMWRGLCDRGGATLMHVYAREYPKNLAKD
jgi:hypothetical protein